MSAATASLLAELRSPHAGVERLHLNNAGIAPTCARAVQAGQRALAGMQDGYFAAPKLLHDHEAARASFARLLGAASEDLAFFHTCAAAASQVALGLSLRPGAEVVVIDQEYASMAYPWRRAAERAGARIVVVESTPDLQCPSERILAAISPRTRVVACSWVQYQTGATIDLRAVADRVHEVGGWLVVDVMQGVGVMPFDMRAHGVDAVCGGTHKWLLGPLSHGYLALAPDRATELAPLLHGAWTYGSPDAEFDPHRPPRPDARRFEPGTPLLVGAISGAAAVELLLAIGIEVVHAEVQLLASTLDAGLRARGYSPLRAPDAASPIVNFRPRRDASEVAAALLRAGASVAVRAGGLRISPHVHNGPQHIDRCLELLEQIDR